MTLRAATLGSLALALLLLLAPTRARTDCALIPTAIKVLPSTHGAVDRPFAPPGEVVTLRAPVQCKPGAGERHFDPDPTQHAVTLYFENGAPAPVVPVDSNLLTVGSCNSGNTRCSALSFPMPDTDDLLLPAGDGRGYTGPARIEVMNQAGESPVLVAEIGPLFEPTKACNKRNRYPTLLKHFSVLPDRNAFTVGTKDILATVDGTGSLLIPFDYSAVLASDAGAAVARFLSVTATLDDGLGGTLLLNKTTEPADFKFVRAFSLEGRPIPPILDVSQAGDSILGSVDFIDSVIRIARQGPDSGDPVKFDVAAALPGPVVLASVTLGAGAAAPLNSLKVSGEAVAVARDERLEAALPSPPTPGGDINGDGDSTDLVVEIIDSSTGASIAASRRAVTQLARPSPKAAIVTQGSVVAFLESEAQEGHSTQNPDADAVDSILRIFEVNPGAGATELTAGTHLAVAPEVQINGNGPFAPSPGSPNDLTYFVRGEHAEASKVTEAASLTHTGGQAGAAAALSPAWLSADGSLAVFNSFADDTVPPVPVVWESTSNATATVTNTGVDPTFCFYISDVQGDFTFDVGDNDVSGLDYGGTAGSTSFTSRLNGVGQPIVFGSFVAPPGAPPTPTFEAVVLESNPGTQSGSPLGPSNEILDTTVFMGSGPFDSVTTTAPLADFASFGLVNPTFDTTLAVDDGSITLIDPAFDGGPCGSVPLYTYTVSGSGTFSADMLVTGPSSRGKKELFVRNLDTGVVELVSSTVNGIPGNGVSDQGFLAGEGRYVAFQSGAPDLVPGSVNGTIIDIFVKDRQTGAIIQLTDGNIGSYLPYLSTDGRFVVFVSEATNILPPDTNGDLDLYLHDRDADENGTFDEPGPLATSLERINVNAAGDQGNGSINFYYVSDDGRYVVYASDSSNLVPGDGNGESDVFLHDRELGTTERISVGVGGAEANSGSYDPWLSADGRFVVFDSEATNLVEDDTNGVYDVFVSDRQTGVLERVSVSSAGVQGDGDSYPYGMTPDGRYVMIGSFATQLVPGDTNGAFDAFVFDRLTRTMERVSLTSAGTESAMDVDVPALSADGHTATFLSFATDIVAGDVNGLPDYFTRRLGSCPPNPPLVADWCDLNGDGDVKDAVLEAHFLGSLASSGTAVREVVVEADQALAIRADDGLPILWNPIDGVSVVAGVGAASQIAMSPEVACILETDGDLFAGVPTTLLTGTAATAVGVVADAVKAVGDRCVFTTLSPSLQIYDLGDDAVTVTGATAADFQVDPSGIAFRSCEADEGAVLNGDADQVDCAMRFWDFVREQDGDPLTEPLIEVGRTAIPCTFPGCDPFFEPYRLRGSVLSFVARESDEVEEGGTARNEAVCLSSSPQGACDLTGDGDGDDVAVQIVNLKACDLAADNCPALVFPVSEETPPEATPFPETVGDGTVLSISAPESFFGVDIDGDGSISDRVFNLIAGDTDGDGVLDADGILNAKFSRADNSPLPNPDQLDKDKDGMGAVTDTLVDETTGELEIDPGTGQPKRSDDAVSDPFFEAPEIPGENLCDLDQSGVISRAEVDQLWADRGSVIDAPFDRDSPPDFVLDAADDRDRDVDGLVSAVDFSLCLADCSAQPVGPGNPNGGCPLTETTPTVGGGYKNKGCGLLGIEALLMLAPLWVRRRRRMRR